MFFKKKTNQRQRGGNNSTNVQVAGDFHSGVTYEDVRKIALDVFKGNFYDLAGNAGKVAQERAEQITENVINDVFENAPELGAKFEDPAVQYSLFNAQREYAKIGDVELEQQLRSLLIERIKSEERSLKQIALDEAINVLPKLTKEHIQIMTLIVSLLYVRHFVNSIESLKDFVINKLMNFYPENLFYTGTFNMDSFYNHLQYTGCFVPQKESRTFKTLEHIFRTRYGGIFNKGFDYDEVTKQMRIPSELVIKCLNNESLSQISALNSTDLHHILEPYGLSSSDNMQIKNLFESTTMNGQEIKSNLISYDARMENFFRIWPFTSIKSIQLTTVGFAIACLNYNRVTDSEIDLSTFI